MTQLAKKLYRDTSDQKIAGVCSGLAHYFNIDPIIVRMAAIVLAFLGGGAIIAYVLMWWLVDPAPTGHWDEPSELPPPTT